MSNNLGSFGRSLRSLAEQRAAAGKGEVVVHSILPEIARELKFIASAGLHGAAEEIAHSAKERVPVRTGKLRDSIHVEEQSTLQVKVVAGDGEAFYGHMVEFGTEHSPARPFLVPAVESNRTVAEHTVAAALRLHL